MDFERIFDGIPVSQETILQSRSDRAGRQREALKLNCESLISFTLNIPGPVKQFSLAQAAFEEGLTGLRTCFSGHIVHEHITSANTSSEAILGLDLSPETVKQQTVFFEEYHPLGRLFDMFDMDVLRRDGAPLSRTSLSLSPPGAAFSAEKTQKSVREVKLTPWMLCVCVSKICIPQI